MAAEAAAVHESIALKAQQRALEERQRELDELQADLSAKVGHPRPSDWELSRTQAMEEQVMANNACIWSLLRT